MKPFFEGEQAARHGGRTKAEELRRRVAVVVAASVSVYAVLVVVSLLGGPRIGAPLIPLPGGGPEVRAAAPVAGELAPGGDGENLPLIPSRPTQEPAVLPPSAGPLDEAGQPKPPVLRSVPSMPPVEPPSAVASRPAEPRVGEPTRGVSEQPARSMPPATDRPPVTWQPSDPQQTPDDPPTGTPDTPPTATPSDPPEPPESPTIVDTLLDLVGDLLP